MLKRKRIFFIAVITLIASMPYLCGGFAETGMQVGYAVYGIALNLLTAWIACHCFGRMFGGESVGIACSALYTLSIIRTYKLTIAWAAREGTAYAFLPLVLYGLYCIFEEDSTEKKSRTAWIPFTVGVLGVAVSHFATFEITVFVLLLYGILSFRRLFQKKLFPELFQMAVPVVLIGAAAFGLQKQIFEMGGAVRLIQSKGLYPAQLAFHFWTVGADTPSGDSGMIYSFPMGVGLVLILALGVFLALWFSGAFAKERGQRAAFAGNMAIISLVLLAMSLKIFPWDRIQTLNPLLAKLVGVIGFPNRFLGWGTACLVLLAGFCIRYFGERDRRLFWAAIAVAFLGITTSDMYLLDYVSSQAQTVSQPEESADTGYIVGGRDAEEKV